MMFHFYTMPLNKMTDKKTIARLLLPVITGLFFVTPQSYAKATLKGSRPNIILIMTDDQGMGDLSCMGNKVLRTPNLDRLYK